MSNLKAIKACTIFALVAGGYAWSLVHLYLWCSDNTWFSGSPNTPGHDVRGYITHKFGVSGAYWQIPLSITLIGVLIGALAEVLSVNLVLIWQTITFTFRVFLRNWLETIALCFLPIVGPAIAAFFTGQRDQYEASPGAFRLRWRYPGAFAVCICGVFFALPWTLDLILEKPIAPQIALLIFSITLLASYLLEHISAGLWLERAKTWATLISIAVRSCQLPRIRDVFAMNLVIYIIALCAAAPVFMFSFFLLTEAAQLESNLENMGIQAPFIYTTLVTVPRYFSSYWYWLISAPSIVFLSICNAKLWVSFEHQEKLFAQNRAQNPANHLPT